MQICHTPKLWTSISIIYKVNIFMKFHAYIFGYPPEINIKYSERILKQFRMCCFSDFDILWHFNHVYLVYRQIWIYSYTCICLYLSVKCNPVLNYSLSWNALKIQTDQTIEPCPGSLNPYGCPMWVHFSSRGQYDSLAHWGWKDRANIISKAS